MATETTTTTPSSDGGGTTEKFKSFLLDNKDTLNKETLPALADDKWAMKQFIDSGNIDQRYFRPQIKPVPAPEPTPVATPVEAIEGGAQATQQAIQDAPIQAQDRIIEEAVQASEEVAQAEVFAEKQEDIITKTNEQIVESEDEITRLSQERAVRDAESLTSVKNEEVSKAQLIVEEQRIKNGIAEKEAEQKIEVSKQQASWAFNKLGLGFSSGIILEVQRIATQGANQLALIKVTGAKYLADTQIAVAKLEQSYSSDINAIIDKYTDVAIGNKQNSIKRIADVQNNLLLNGKQKEDAINKIKDEYKTNTRGIQDNLRSEQERLADKQIAQTQQLEAQITNEQNQQKTVINGKFESGAWFNLTDTQKNSELVKAWLTLEEGRAIEKTTFSKTITSEVSEALWNNVTITGGDRGAIQTLSRSYMEGGLIYSEATKRATLDYIESVPRLSRVRKIQDAKLKAALAPRGTGWVKPLKNPFIKIDSENRQLEFNNTTWIWEQSVDADNNPVFGKESSGGSDYAELAASIVVGINSAKWKK